MEDEMKMPRQNNGGEPAVASEYTRRNILLGSAALLVGRVSGGIGKAFAVPEPTHAPAPSLPWKWTRLDPMEAGTRAYRNYLKNKG